jgi:hypothetical protein
MKERCVPAGLDRLLEKAGDDVATLQIMLEVMDRMIARRKQLEEMQAYKNRSALPTTG